MTVGEGLPIMTTPRALLRMTGEGGTIAIPNGTHVTPNAPSVIPNRSEESKISI